MNPMMLIDAALACLVAFIVVRVVTIYVQSTGTVWERLLATSKGSATVLQGYAVLIGGAALTGAEKATEILNLPEAQAFIQAHIPAVAMGWVAIASAVLAIVARLRTLCKA